TSAFSSMMDPFDVMGDFSSGHGMEMTTGDTVAIIEMTGEISYDWTNCSPEGLKYQLDVAEEDPNIKAVVLRVNSGGGTATAGEEMAAYVRDFSKPIVVSSAATNASAAYEISSQTDYIFVGQTTMIGSIGTALQLTDLSGLYEKLGINIENITSADNKDATYGTRPLTDAEREHYQALVDQINDTFIQTVADGRGMTVEVVRALATGMTFSGIDAVENGLADEIGSLEDALDKAAELSDADSDYDVVYLEPDYAYDLYSLLGMKAKGDASGASGESAADALFLKEMEDGFGTR
ncbi:MAG: signal peptide peptidase SppA, partial [Eggerthellaceae bacterium]|nr:signal peptide peptidase SppA [Eggerthellaceae bacterium]